jgi:hypothetical protein
MKKRIISVMLAVGLISALGIAPAFAITIDTGQDDAKQVLSPTNDDGTANDAHGPKCGDLDCPHNASPVGEQHPGGISNDFGDQNVGAWNGVGQSNDNSAIISP